MKQHELDAWVEGFLSYQRDVRRLAPRTVVDIKCTLKKVSAALASKHPTTPLWKLRLEDFLYWLEQARAAGQSEQALAKDLSHVRGLLEYAWRSGKADRNVLDGFSLQDAGVRKEPKSLSLEEAAALVHACPRQTAEERRSRLIILLLYGCGFRTAELCGLDVSDVNVERREVLVRAGKGGRQRTIPVPAAAWSELLAYLLEDGRKRGPLFRTKVKSARIGQDDVGDIVKLAAARAGIREKVTARTLRHTFATHLMDAGVDIAVIASLMGHRSPSETGIYLHVLPGKKQRAVDALASGKEKKETPS
ncbi:MAG: tyrosine-type recombinase/integrase [Archangium sp.]|nr:tyrosine-type recombinase/integrase [Archangium sp.]